jgi:signal transduction histidine kinase
VDQIHRSLDGREVRVNVSGAPIRDDAGHILGAVQVLRDVTELRRQEAERGHMLSLVSHELKTPLTSVKARVQMSRRRLQRAQSPEADTLGRVEHDVGRLERLVNDLLDASRVESGKLEIHPDRCELAALCQRVIDEQIATTGRDIALDAPEGDVWTTVDADRIEQVLGNLLSNALKYSPEQTPVHVALSTVDAGAAAEIAVRDHGLGIAPDAQASLFDRFYRVPGVSVQSGSGVGLGLGLYICREIVERHGGSIGAGPCASTGAGTCIRVELPLAGPEK